MTNPLVFSNVLSPLDKNFFEFGAINCQDFAKSAQKMILIRRLTNSTSKKDDVSPLHGAYGGVITGEPACVFLSTTRWLTFGSVVFVGKGAGSMEIGIVGLGKMGANIAMNLKDSGHRVVGFDMSEAARAAVETEDIETVDSMAGLVSAARALLVLYGHGPFRPHYRCGARRAVRDAR